MIKGAIFDMDGTLVDSMTYWRNLASEFLQIKGLKTALSKLMEADPSKEDMVAQLAMQTNGFTNISKADCEELIKRVSAMLNQEVK